YEDANGEVLIVLEQIDSDVVISIIDQGKGMSSELIKKVLEGGVTTKQQGNGLGVSSALVEIKKHGGKLDIDSAVGEGTRITVSIQQAVAPNWFVEEIEVSENSKKVICVDDDPGFLELYHEKLKESGKLIQCINVKNIEQLEFSTEAEYFLDYDLGREK